MRRAAAVISKMTELQQIQRRLPGSLRRKLLFFNLFCAGQSDALCFVVRKLVEMEGCAGYPACGTGLHLLSVTPGILHLVMHAILRRRTLLAKERKGACHEPIGRRSGQRRERRDS